MMQGKTRGFFEDTGIILVLLALLYGIYSLYTNTSKENQDILKTIKTTIIPNSEEIEVEKKIVEEQKIETAPEIKKTIIKKTSLPVVEKEVKIEKVKNVDLVKLREFLRDLKFSMVQKIVKRDDINTSISQELQIRVTVLEDGSYEKLIYVSGDKVLFEMNKENIVKVFPVQIDENIKDDFPRYVRFSIK